MATVEGPITGLLVDDPDLGSVTSLRLERRLDGFETQVAHSAGEAARAMRHLVD